MGQHTLPHNNYLSQILQSIKNSHESFNRAIGNHTNLNEDELTQIFVKQNSLQLQLLGASCIYVGVQYRDFYHKTKGIPDIHYSFNEQGVDYEPEFVMEAKRLPVPSKNREKEYVIGLTQNGNPNGGIERFKLGKHGMGLQQCGMLGYVEKEDYGHWLKTVNGWIEDLSRQEGSIWDIKELLNDSNTTENSFYTTSNAIRVVDEIVLHHFWFMIHPAVKE